MLDERPAGVGVYIEAMCSRLIALNPDAVVYTADAARVPPWLRTMEVREFPRSGLPEVSHLEGARRRARRLRWLAGPCALALPRDGVDVLFSPVQEGPLVGQTPTVMVMHDLTALKFPEAYGWATVAQTRYVVPRMLRRAAKVVAVSANTRADVIETFGLDDRAVEVIGEGVDRETFRPRRSDEIVSARRSHRVTGRYLLYAGTFSRHKNLTVLARALAVLPSDLNLVLVGRKDAGAFSEFEAEARRVGTWNRVVTPGYVTRTDLAALMSDASLFVYPSRYEGFGLAPLEAMACGAPVAASAVASLPEVVGQGGVLVPDSTDAAWATALRRGLELDRRAAQAAALAQAARFDWDEAARRLFELLRTVALAGGSR